MAIDFSVTNFNDLITDGTTNSGIPSEEESSIGIKYNSLADAVILNKFFYNLSSAIEYVQSKGSIIWQKDKNYTKGSIVNIIEFIDNSYVLRKFRCIDIGNNTPVIGTSNIDTNRLTTYFTNITGINSNWIELFDGDNSSLNVTINEKSKGITLFEIPNQSFFRNNFNIYIKRFNGQTMNYDILSFDVEFTCNEFNGDINNVYVEVYNVYCSNYNRTNVQKTETDGFYNPDTYGLIFGNSRYALLGFYLSINNGKLNLEMYSDDNSYIDITKKVEIKITSNISNIEFTNIEIVDNYDILGENTILIKDGSNNIGDDCGYLVETTVKLNSEEMFRRSLIPILTDLCIDPTSRRPGYSKPFNYEFEPKNMISIVSSNSNINYNIHCLPLITGFASFSPNGENIFTSYYTGQVSYKMESSDFLYTSFIGTKLQYYTYNGMTTKQRAGIGNSYYGVAGLVRWKYKTTVCKNIGNLEDNIFYSKQPELSIYNKKPALYPKSKRVYRYYKY